MSPCVAFGPNDSHLFNSPKQWSMSGLPESVNALFNGQSKISEVNEIALGPEGSYAITYSHHAGMSLLHSGLPVALENWLVPVHGKGITRHVPSLRIALGPNGAFFAFDNNGSAWGALPDAMNNAVAMRRDAYGSFQPNEGPSSVALGANGAYVFITASGGGFWNLQGQNDVLQKFLTERKSLQGVHVVLSPCRPGIYIILLTTGECAGCVPTSQFSQYNALAADWKFACRHHAAPRLPTVHHAISRSPPVAHHSPSVAHHSRSSTAATNNGIIQGMKLANSIWNSANGIDNGGGQTYFTDDYTQ